MIPWLERHLLAAVGALGASLLVALVLIGVLFWQLHETRDNLERVEAGSAFFASQVQSVATSLQAAEPEVDATLEEAIAGLRSFRSSTLEFPVQLDQPVAIDTEVRINREVTIPVNTTLPIDQSFETTIEVQGPLGLVVPVEVTVPVTLDVPIDLDLAVPIDETVPIQTTIPVEIDVPVTLPVAETELASLIDVFIEGLVALQALLDGVGVR